MGLKTFDAKKPMFETALSNRDRSLKREKSFYMFGATMTIYGRSLDVFISNSEVFKEDPSVQIVNYHGVVLS